MITKERIESIERYLSSLDDSLIAEGVDPNKRLDYVEQVADSVVCSGSEPEEEFGSPKTYAARLASSLRVRRRRPWLRALALGLGIVIAFNVGFVTGLDLMDRWETGTMTSYGLPFGELVIGLLFGLGFWFTISPSGVRLHHQFYTLPTILRVLATAVWCWPIFLVPLVAPLSEIVVVSLSGNQTAALVGAALLVGPLMVWWSGAFQLAVSQLGTPIRLGSLISYKPLETRKVELDKRTLYARIALGQ